MWPIESPHDILGDAVGSESARRSAEKSTPLTGRKHSEVGKYYSRLEGFESASTRAPDAPPDTSPLSGTTFRAMSPPRSTAPMRSLFTPGSTHVTRPWQPSTYTRRKPIDARVERALHVPGSRDQRQQTRAVRQPGPQSSVRTGTPSSNTHINALNASSMRQSLNVAAPRSRPVVSTPSADRNEGSSLPNTEHAPRPAQTLWQQLKAFYDARLIPQAVWTCPCRKPEEMCRKCTQWVFDSVKPLLRVELDQWRISSGRDDGPQLGLNGTLLTTKIPYPELKPFYYADLIPPTVVDCPCRKQDEICETCTRWLFTAVKPALRRELNEWRGQTRAAWDYIGNAPQEFSVQPTSSTTHVQAETVENPTPVRPRTPQGAIEAVAIPHGAAGDEQSRVESHLPPTSPPSPSRRRHRPVAASPHSALSSGSRSHGKHTQGHRGSGSPPKAKSHRKRKRSGSLNENTTGNVDATHGVTTAPADKPASLNVPPMKVIAQSLLQSREALGGYNFAHATEAHVHDPHTLGPDTVALSRERHEGGGGKKKKQRME